MTMNLKELAAELGLSQTTVSRALNGYPEVSEKTRRRVVAAAKRYGYTPSMAARRLATGRAHALGIVFATDSDVPLDPVFVEYLAGVAEACEAGGFDIVVCPTKTADERAAYERLIVDGTVDALLVPMPREDDERLALLKEVGFPFVVHGRPSLADCPSLDIDNYGGFFAATTYLVGLGHRRLALLNGDRRATFAIDRERGVIAALAAAGLDGSALLSRSLPMAVETSYRVAHDILGQPDRPTALLCSSVLVALGALRAAAEHGLSVPDDLSLIAHDDMMPAFAVDHLHPPLTTTSSSIRAAGARVAERALSILAGAPPGLVNEIWPAELVVRASTAPVT